MHDIMKIDFNFKLFFIILLSILNRVISAFVSATRIALFPLFVNLKFQVLSIISDCTGWFVSELVGNYVDRFSDAVTQVIEVKLG